ncbi:unnamed protein product [Rhizoctonia solani]|uniref:Ricin B lectin domain-containing protein n=1 Tax=Rhizoctonia solani TaxID=456999 RepID=A0A8H2XAZ0_9AGAM|nr:unnamed protein product [Rhizoctonia solani]
MKPGTYRIVNIVSDTAITKTESGIVGWRREAGNRQLWFAQPSGKGYQFKNVASGGYLAISSTTDNKNKLYCGGYPTTWMLVSNPEYTGNDTYGIIMGDTDRILDLSNWGDRADGTVIFAVSHTQFTGGPKCRVWIFERISDETDEDSPSLSQTREALICAEKINKTQESEISFLRHLLTLSLQSQGKDSEVLQLKSEVARLTSQVERLERTLAEVSSFYAA